MKAVLQDLASKQNAIEILAADPNQATAADKLGVHESTVSRFKVKHQDAIQLQAEKYLAALPSIVDQDLTEMKEAVELSAKLVGYLKEGSKITEIEANGKTETIELFPEKEVRAIQKFLDYTDKKVTDIKRSIGIYSSHTPAMIYQTMNIYNDNRSVISPSVLRALTGGARSSTTLPTDVVINPDIVDK